MSSTRNARSACWLAAALTVCLSGCTADFPVGAIVCNESSECPEGMSCLFEGGSADGRCFPGGDTTQKNMATDPSSLDASSSSSKPRDAAPADEPNEDTGAASAGRGGSDNDHPQQDAEVVEPRDAGPSGNGASRDAGAAKDSGAQAGAGGSPDVERDAGFPDAGDAGDAGASAGSGGASGSAAGSGGEPKPPEPPAPCDDPARECNPTDLDAAEEMCGLCGTGLRTQTRSCDPNSCRWQAWSAWSECADPAECMPGTSESRSVACPGCGSKSQTRVCSQTTCMYEEWRDASSCSWCAACGELVYCDTPDDVAPNRGTWCKPENGCNHDQAWGRCLELLQENSCNLHEPHYIGN